MHCARDAAICVCLDEGAGKQMCFQQRHCTYGGKQLGICTAVMQQLPSGRKSSTGTPCPHLDAGRDDEVHRPDPLQGRGQTWFQEASTHTVLLGSRIHNTKTAHNKSSQASASMELQPPTPAVLAAAQQPTCMAGALLSCSRSISWRGCRPPRPNSASRACCARPPCVRQMRGRAHMRLQQLAPRLQALLSLMPSMWQLYLPA